MKTITLYSLLFLLALGATGKSANHTYRSMVENREALIHLLGEQRAELGILMFSPIVQSIQGGAAGKGLAFTRTLDSLLTTYRAPGSQNWVNDWKTEYNYNQNLLATEIVEKEWVASQNNWRSSSRVTMSYNNQGLPVEVLFYESNSQSAESKMEVYYDNAGKVDSILTYEASGSAWIHYATQYYQYNTAGQPERIDTWFYDEDEEEWMDVMYSLIEYDASGRRTSTSTYLSDDEDEEEDWLYSRTEYTYNGSGQLTEITYSAISFTTFQMEPASKTEYAYNNAGDHSMYTDYDWAGGAWVPEYKEEYTYHSSLAFNEVSTPYFIFALLYNMVEATYVYNKMIVSAEGYEPVDGEFVLVDRTTFFISGDTSTGLPGVPQVEAMLYPNPATSYVGFLWTGSREQLTLELYQVTGARVMHHTVHSGVNVSIEHLNRGIYLYRLIDNGHVVHAGKLLKQ